jgi:hypothetical protein
VAGFYAAPAQHARHLLFYAPVSRLARQPLLLTTLAVLAILPTAGLVHLPHPGGDTGSTTTVALDASHAEQSPHLESSALAHVAPCALCLVQRQARELAKAPAQTGPLLAAAGNPLASERLAVTRRIGAQGARAPPFS